jgi:hypothetical protein
MDLIYISGHYTADTDAGIQANIDAAKVVAERLALRGLHFFCPHLNTYDMHRLPVFPQFWYDLDINILRRCDAIYIMTGWENSKGARWELKVARAIGLKVYWEDRGDFV